MSVMDKLKDMLKGHESQAHQGVEKAGDMVDKKTGDKYKSQVDMVQGRLDQQIGGQPPAAQPPTGQPPAAQPPTDPQP
ncbi:antitoxin [Streptacidiphilus sp. PB12-B1b]|nr:antitoxin [Streptacidiphilus sp. PB12-B1b]QMU80550.1 antitoxin [Streptacidiphilus sp. PB12-B1b]